jgi:DNA-binding YbaB/EbfC family protein
MGTGFAKKKKQAKMFQEQLSKMQNDMQNAEAVGSAGNGLVTVTLNGEHEVKKIKINPECVDKDDIEGLEDLMKAAFNDAVSKLKDQSMKNMPNMNPGMFNF